MARESPPGDGDGDGRGTPLHGPLPTGEPQGGSALPGARNQGEGQGVGVGRPDAIPPPAGEKQVGSGVPGARKDGESHGVGAGSRDAIPTATAGQAPPVNNTGDGFGWSTNFWAFFSKQGFDGLMASVRDLRGNLYSTVSREMDMDSSGSEGLPRLNVYCDTVLSPPMTKSEEIELKQYLEHVLKQVQYSVKLMGLQPVALHDVEIIQPSLSRQYAEYAESGFQTFVDLSRKYPWMIFVTSPVSGSHNYQAELEEKELQNAELISAYENFISQFKLFIAASLDNNHISQEFANQLLYIVECYSKNVQKALNAGGYLLTLKCFVGRIETLDKANSWIDNCKALGSLALFVVTFLDGANQNVGSSPMHFSSIGKQANGILDIDFTFDKLKLNCDAYKKLSVGVGHQFGGQQTVSEILVKCKDESRSFSINMKEKSEDNIAANGGAAVPDNDMVKTRVSISKICGSDMRCVLKMPFPSLNGKFEVRHGIPYAVCAGGVYMVPNPDGPIPVLDCSIVGGIKCMGLGAHFQLRAGQISSTLGMSFKSDLLALGLTCKSRSNFNATIWKRVVDSSTTIAARATYRPPAGANQGPPADGVLPGLRYTLGVRRAVDPTLYLKARVGTDGASVLVKKSNVDGMLTFKGAVHVDFNNPWRVPKIGAVCSFRL